MLSFYLIPNRSVTKISLTIHIVTMAVQDFLKCSYHSF